MRFLAVYVDSMFQDFGSFFRTQVDLVQDDIRLVLDEYNSSFITYEWEPGIYTFKDNSDVVSNILQSKYPGPSNVNIIEFDDISKKTKLVGRNRIIVKKNRFLKSSSVTNFIGIINTIINTLARKLNLSATNKIHLKCDCFNGSNINGVQQLILFSFVLDKPTDYKLFCEPGTIRHKKVNKSILKTLTFYLKANESLEVNFNQEMLTFTLKTVKIQWIKGALKNLKVTVIALEGDTDLLQWKFMEM